MHRKEKEAQTVSPRRVVVFELSSNENGCLSASNECQVFCSVNAYFGATLPITSGTVAASP